MQSLTRKSSAILEVSPCEDETLLIWRDSLFVLNPVLDVVDSVAAFAVDLQGFARQSLDENCSPQKNRKRRRVRELHAKAVEERLDELLKQSPRDGSSVARKEILPSVE